MANAPQTDDHLKLACERVGRFLFHYALAERSLDMALAKLFELNEDAADVITVNIPLTRKLDVLSSAVAIQAAEKSRGWKEQADELLKAFRNLNDPYRITIAHSSFDAAGADAVRFRRTTARKSLKREEPLWDAKKFEDLYSRLESCSSALEQLAADLKPYRGGTYHYLGF